MQSLLYPSIQDSQETRRLHFYNHKEEIPLLPQGIWHIHRGVIQLSSISTNGDEILLGWAKTGQYFGYWFTGLQLYTATALMDSCITWYGVNEIESSPTLCQQILPSMVARMKQTELLLSIGGQRRVEERLFQLLVLLKQELGQPVETGTRIMIRLTHQQIAGTINSTRVTITRLLSKLEQEGYITLDKRRHIVINDEKFANMLNL